MYEPDTPSLAPKPLAGVFLSRLIVAYVFLALFVFGVQFVQEYRVHRQQLRASLETLSDTFAPGAAAALWDFQEGSLQSMVKGIGRHADVAAVEIKSTNGSLYFSWEAPDGMVPSSTLRVERDLIFVNRNGEEKKVGTLIIASSEQRLWALLRGVIVSTVLTGSALMLVVGVAVWLLVRTLVVWPLTQFTKQVQAMGAGGVPQYSDLGGTRIAEFATLQQRFSQLMGQVAQDQERIAEQNATLEQRVADRTKELEAANRAKGEFLARMSHEIRTPMNAVIGLSNLTLRTELDAVQRNYLEKVLGSAQALLGIINDILDFSKIEAGKLSIESIAFDVRASMDNLSSMLGFKASEKGLRLDAVVGPDVPALLMGDAMRLGQVLLNLTGNALKFTEKGGVRVTVDVVSRTDSRVRLRFGVEDSGIGMTPEEVGQLFQSFHQTDGSITRRFGGTGLGLAISKQLVELMGGKVWVESTPGVGSKFLFELEFALATALAIDQRQASVENSPIRRKVDRIRGAKVLLVEDNAINQLVARSLLEINGVVVDIANNGLEGVEKALKGDYALVLMDIQMPEMDGLTATRQIRATPGFDALPIVAMTANAMATDYQSSIDAGMNDHITKPIDHKQLTATLERWILPA